MERWVVKIESLASILTEVVWWHFTRIVWELLAFFFKLDRALYKSNAV